MKYIYTIKLETWSAFQGTVIPKMIDDLLHVLEEEIPKQHKNNKILIERETCT